MEYHREKEVFFNEITDSKASVSKSEQKEHFQVNNNVTALRL